MGSALCRNYFQRIIKCKMSIIWNPFKLSVKSSWWIFNLIETLSFGRQCSGSQSIGERKSDVFPWESLMNRGKKRVTWNLGSKHQLWDFHKGIYFPWNIIPPNLTRAVVRIWSHLWFNSYLCSFYYMTDPAQMSREDIGISQVDTISSLMEHSVSGSIDIDIKLIITSSHWQKLYV